MNNFSYLRSIKPKYSLLIYIILISVIIIFITSFIFKVKDVYNTRGYIECSDKCNIKIMVDYLDISKIGKIDFIKINKENKYPININIGDIMVDENSKSNY